ncbi:MAG TPA: glycoside hydrolase family 3 N-terminal domain-containing protein [Ruminiclostridium sp.]|nr:glycoside hydrolase family 3 N-terminal domain-containing protein [Ruminiclostridium sp.]
MLKYKNSLLDTETRVEDLLERMTLKEKIGQLNQRIFGWRAYKKTGDSYEITEEFKNEVAFGDGLGALYGLFRADPWSAVTFENGIPWEDCAKVTNKFQRYVLENTRLEIPLLFSEECPHGHMALDGTIFPTNLGIGSTWNPELYKEAFACVASEIRSRGGHLGLVSALDIMQDPRWGRSEECFGEDPYLAACMTYAVTRGMQGDTAEDLKRSDKVAAVLKHFCAQGAAVGGHNGKSAVIGERELREIHLLPMKAGIKAGAVGCMAAYNEIDGIYCHANSFLLTDILRKEWGFSGVVMSDGCAVDNLKRIAGSEEGAVAAAVNAGVDMNLWNHSYLSLEAAVTSGKVSEKVIDEAVRRVLNLKFMMGLFDKPFTDEDKSVFVAQSIKSSDINLRVAHESVVLLKNENNVLPLKRELNRIAVIGPNADEIYNQLGDYTPPQRPGTGTTVLQGIRSSVSQGTEVVYSRGCGVRDTSKDGFSDAVKAAKNSDAVILVLGGSSARNFDVAFDKNGAAIVSKQAGEMDCGEGMDVANLELGGVQVELVKEIFAVGKPVITVLIQGRPHAIPWISESCPAVLCAWYPGKEGGKAIADIIFGDVNPSGRLSVSIPRSSAQLPVYYNYKEISGYLDMPAAPLYPFGFGLSYTTFEYGSMALSRQQISADELERGGTVAVTVNVTNIGTLEGKEVVQLYISGKNSGINRRIKELKGFKKIQLAPGETRTVVLKLGKDELGIWDEELKFIVKPGNVEIVAGYDPEKALKEVLCIV